MKTMTCPHCGADVPLKQSRMGSRWRNHYLCEACGTELARFVGPFGVVFATLIFFPMLAGVFMFVAMLVILALSSTIYEAGAFLDAEPPVFFLVSVPPAILVSAYMFAKIDRLELHENEKRFGNAG